MELTYSTDRWASVLGGAALVVWGADRLAKERRPGGALLATAGVGLIWRAVRDGSRYDTRERLSGSRGTQVEETVAINRSPTELYRFWRDFSRLPVIMPEVAIVKVIDNRRSHWIARGPARTRVEWDAEIINDIEDTLIAWRTMRESDLVSAGAVHFEPAPSGRGTVVRVTLQYDPPGGKAGSALAWIFGDEPSQVIREGLRRFKQLMEAGGIATTEGQPRGAR